MLNGYLNEYRVSIMPELAEFTTGNLTFAFSDFVIFTM